MSLKQEPLSITTFPRRRAFTAMEVLLALSLSTFIGLCLMTLTAAVGDAWFSQDEQAVLQMTKARSRNYMERIVQNSQDVGYWSAGSLSEPATLLLWSHDLFDQQGVQKRDHRPQRAELLLLQYDPEAKKLRLYRTQAWSLLPTSSRLEAAGTLTMEELNSASTAELFRTSAATQSFTILGDAQTAVTAAKFSVSRSYERPVVHYEFELVRDGRPARVQGSIGLRTPSASDDWTSSDLITEALAAADTLPIVDGDCSDTSTETSSTGESSTTEDDTLDLFNLFGGG